MGKYFGTDGVRGIANTELSCKLAFQVGQAGAIVLTEQLHHKPTILIGKDTRISGDMLEAAMVAGICSVGANAMLLGVVPTPAVAHLTRKYQADAGIVISASHNPMEYNGIKFFDGQGYKLSDELEARLENLIDKKEELPLKEGGEIGWVVRAESAVEDYVQFLCETVETPINGLKVAVDCANGAASATAKKLFLALGVEADVFFDTPDGTNINAGCGSTHLNVVGDIVKKGSYDLGIAFDGDADRFLCVDENGDEIDGDKIIAACACQLKQEGKLDKNSVVVTVMTNLGFFVMGKEQGIDIKTTKVGDRYVLEEMVSGGYSLGGEQSGHIIFSLHNTTGDGQLTALKFLQVLRAQGKKASEVATIMDTYPQILINVPLISNEAKEQCEKDAEVLAEIRAVEEKLGEHGRVLVRPSGTERLTRVMLEGKNYEEIRTHANRIADIIKRKFGMR